MTIRKIDRSVRITNLLNLLSFAVNVFFRCFRATRLSTSTSASTIFVSDRLSRERMRLRQRFNIDLMIFRFLLILLLKSPLRPELTVIVT